MSIKAPSEVTAAFEAKYDWLKREQFPSVGKPDKKGIDQNPEGGWQQWFENWASITLRPGEIKPHEVHGAICARWAQEGEAFTEKGERGWLGYPISDEEPYNEDGDPNDRISHFENGDIVWTAKTDATRIVNIKDRARWYKVKHDQLLDLLRRAVEAPAPERHNEALKAVEDKCKEDQFDVVLLGAFQYGKSTTLDILCGGREVSPQGEGTTPTSAVPVSVQSLSKDEDKEWGEIRYKSKRALTEELFDTFEKDIVEPGSEHILLQYVPEGEESVRERFCGTFDFDDPEHRACARKALEDAWAKYGESNESKFRFSSRQRQLMEVESLVLRFYDSIDRGSDNAERCPVEAIGPYVWFPSDWSENAALGFSYDIAAEDARFAFVERAILHLRSPFLEELECRVTDCPGLDASAYDKEVTRKALLRADGILFVRRFDKAIGQSDLGTIFEFVQDTGRTSKTVLALNLWGISRNVALVPHEDRRGRKTPSLVGASKQKIEDDGFNFPIVWCHILLAYLSAIADRRIRTGESFTEDERKWLAEKSGGIDATLPDDKLWIEAVRETNRIFKVPELATVVALDAEAVRLVLKASNFEELIGSVKNTVLREKTGSILVDNGSRKALETLKSHERELQLKEEAAHESEQKCAEEVAAARHDLDEYEKETESAVASSRLGSANDDVVQSLSRSLVDDVLDDGFHLGLSRRIAKTVRKLNKDFEGLSQNGFLRKMREEVGPLIADYFEDKAIGMLEKWREEPKGRWRLFLGDVKELGDKIQELGAARFEGKRLFKNVPIPTMPTDINDEEISGQISDSLDGLDAVAESLREGFFSQVLNVLSWPFDKIASWFGMEKTESEILSEYAEQFQPVLEKSFRDRSTGQILEKGVRPVFADILRQILDSLAVSRASYRKKIQARCDELVELHRSSDAELRRVAEENRKLREECIAPLRSEIEAFETSVQTAQG